MGNNILSPESFVFNVKIGHVIIRICGVTISVKARQRNQFLKKRILDKNDGVISLRFEISIPLLPVPRPDNGDYSFHPAIQINLTSYAYIIDHKTSAVLIRNTFN